MVLNGIITDVGTVIRDRRVTRPDAQICYHSIKVDEADPQKFHIEVKHNVIFVPKNEELADRDINCHNTAAKEELKVWNTNVLKTLWAVRWAPKGLIPIKPSVHLTGFLKLSPGKACRCSA